MRWNAQQIDDTQALLPMRGLVRSVRTPEFAGVTFHEVACRSALNKVPTNSSMPFTWTINPTRGCLHQCTYCLSPDALILMADGRQKPLQDAKVGDRVVGTSLQGKYRRYVEAEVQAVWRTVKRAYRVTLRDGTQLSASGDHRFLTERGWKHVAPAEPGAGQRPYLTSNDRLMGFGAGDARYATPAPEDSRAATIRIPGGRATHRRFFHHIGPSITRKLTVVGDAVKTSSDLRVESVEFLGDDQDLIDITTSTGDFIANGVISHNCFARKTHEYLDLDAGKDFDTQIVVKTNIVEVLRAELARPSWKREHVALGTNSDPYMRAEGRYELMPGIIEALAQSGTPFSILTKGPLLRRDLPLLARVAPHTRVGVSLAFCDPALQQRVEPGTPPPAARLGLIRAIGEAGLDAHVLAMPILPWLTDDTEHLEELFAAVREAGAGWISAGPLHLRPGAREWFMAWLAREHPDLVGRYRRLYGNSAYVPKDYAQWLSQRVREIRRRLGFTRPEPMTDDDGEDRWQHRGSPQGAPGAGQGRHPGAALEPAHHGQQGVLF